MNLPCRFDRSWFIDALDRAVAHHATLAPGAARVPPTIPAPAWSADLSSALDRTCGRGKFRQEIDLALPRIQRLMTVAAPIRRVRDYLWQMLSIEWLAQVDLERTWHRDHLLHPARVAMIGDWFLDDPGVLRATASRLRTVWGPYARTFGVRSMDWKRIARLAWLCAGLYHDHCFPVELSGKVHDRVCGCFGLGGMEPSLRKVKRHLRKLAGLRFANVIAGDDLRKACEHLHAPLGALSLLLDNGFGRGLDPLWDLVLEIAAVAVFRHHADRPISFDDEPITFLLFLADGMQEWGRASSYYFADRFARGSASPKELRRAWESGTIAIGTVIPCRFIKALSYTGGILFRFHLATRSDLALVDFDLERMRDGLNELQGKLRPGRRFPLMRFDPP